MSEIDRKAFAAGHHQGCRGRRAKADGWRAAQGPALLAGYELGKRHRLEMLREAEAFVGTREEARAGQLSGDSG